MRARTPMTGSSRRPSARTLVEDGMTLGLGTGSTAANFVDLVGSASRPA